MAAVHARRLRTPLGAGTQRVAAVAGGRARALTSSWSWSAPGAGDCCSRRRACSFGFRWLTGSFLVATFFNNFLPSNIGGDVIRIADTASAAGSKTLATTVVLIDRGIGLLGLVLLAAVGATAGTGAARRWRRAAWSGTLVAGLRRRRPGSRAGAADARRHCRACCSRSASSIPNGSTSGWTGSAERLSRFREAPGALLGCFVGAVAVQAVLVGFYLAIARSMAIPIGFSRACGDRPDLLPGADGCRCRSTASAFARQRSASTLPGWACRWNPRCWCRSSARR